MNNTDAIEQAYRNGYEDGKRDAVRHGRWKQTTEPLGWNEVDCVECSVCGESWVIDEDFGFDETTVFWRYCPNCGAKMDGEIHDNKDE